MDIPSIKSTEMIWSDPIISTVYIDEAGDLGINVGTQWFVLSAVIVDQQFEKNIREKLSNIKSKLNVREIHLRNIKEFNRKAYIVKELQDEQFVYINIIADTKKLDKTLSPIIAYNYLCRYLIERVSWYLHDTNRLAHIVLSSRGTSRDKELIEYLREKLIPFANNEIKDRFLTIKAKSASQWDLLQLADVCATSMFLSHEVNKFGFCVPCFSSALSKHLYKRKNQYIKYGIKYFNDDMQPDKNYLKSKWICNK